MKNMTDKMKAINLIRTTSKLEDGVFYKGKCRNAWIAMWDSNKNCFIHLRTKFGNTFAEQINHPEDDNGGFDVFIPVEKIERDY